MIEEKPKTKVYGVFSKETEIVSGVTPHNILLGVIKWHPNWRQYSFFPVTDYETVFEKTCLGDITRFMIQLMNDRRKKPLGDSV